LSESDTIEGVGIAQYITPDEKIVTPPTAPPIPTPPDVVAKIEQYRPTRFKPRNILNRVSPGSVAYAKLVEWIPDAPGGVLLEISATADPNALYRLVISDEEMWKDKAIVSGLSMPFDRMPVPGDGKSIRVEVKSTGPSITVDGNIIGEQKL